MAYVPVCWPEIQYYLDMDGFEENSYLINDDAGMDEFGGSAYFIDEDWLEEADKELYGKKEEDKDTPYFVKEARGLEESVEKYLNDAKYKFVIIHEDKPVVYEDGDDRNCPVVFGDWDDITFELKEWPMPIRNISIITEEDYIKTYLPSEWKKYNNNK